MPGLFISYRRDDSSGYAGRVHEFLRPHFPEGYVFVDFTGIPLGEDFVATVQKRIASSDALILLIGKWWTVVKNESGLRRLDDPGDIVRLEIESALRLGVPIIPLLVAGAEMPSNLPSDIQGLTRLQALRVSDEFFDQNMKALLSHLRRRVVPASSEASAFAAEREFERYQATGQKETLQVKIALIGASGVGKTSLVRRYVDARFSDSYITTIGVNIKKKKIQVGARDVHLMLWDTAGEGDSEFDRGLLRGIQGAICVADGLRRPTLQTALRLGAHLKQENDDVVRMLAINKADLIQDWQVAPSEIDALASAEWTLFTTSAKTGKGVEEMFTSLARAIVGKWGPVVT